MVSIWLYIGFLQHSTIKSPDYKPNWFCTTPGTWPSYFFSLVMFTKLWYGRCSTAVEHAHLNQEVVGSNLTKLFSLFFLIYIRSGFHYSRTGKFILLAVTTLSIMVAHHIIFLQPFLPIRPNLVLRLLPPCTGNFEKLLNCCSFLRLPDSLIGQDQPPSTG